MKTLSSQSFPAIESQLKRWLSPARFQHSLGCAHLAAALAQHHLVSVRRAFLAGLVHDCARDHTPQALKRLLQAYQGRHCPAATRNIPVLWHNPAGIVLAKTKLHLQDPILLRAIGLHSTGAPGMNSLDQIIYVADFCEPHRKHATAGALQALAFRDLHKAVRRVTQEKISYLRQHGATIHPYSIGLAKELGLLK